jgi:hypothetical protein
VPGVAQKPEAVYEQAPDKHRSDYHRIENQGQVQTMAELVVAQWRLHHALVSHRTQRTGKRRNAIHLWMRQDKFEEILAWKK